jgi:flagellar basal-body rod protein FlgF
MPKGVYAAASAMVVESKSLDVIAHNLANLQSAGYRAQVPLRDSFAEALARQGKAGDITTDGGAGVFPSSSYVNFREGSLERTDAPLDLALTGAVVTRDERQVQTVPFYRVQDPQGKVYLTRDSRFTIDGEGRLVTSDGWPVEGQGGAITMPAETARVIVDEGGRVYSEQLTEDGPVQNFVDQLHVVTVTDPHRLRPSTGQLFEPGDEPQTDADPAEFKVHQGFVERSNVDAIQQLVAMISTQRRYDAAQRALKQQTSTGSDYSDVLRGV